VSILVTPAITGLFGFVNTDSSAYSYNGYVSTIPFSKIKPLTKPPNGHILNILSGVSFDHIPTKYSAIFVSSPISN